MDNKINIVLIPFWVRDVLVRKALPLNTVLNLPKLRQVLSISDAATLVSLQDNIVDVLGIDGTSDLWWSWLNSVPNSEDAKQYDMAVTQAAAQDPSVKNEVASRLFNPLQKVEGEVPYITYDLTPTTVGVVLNKGYDTNIINSTVPLDIVRSILAILYVYNQQHVVAKTQIFERYLRLLSVM